MEQTITDESALSVDDLLERGVSFTTPCRSWISRLRGKSQRTWTIQPLYLGTISSLSDEQVLLQINEEDLEHDTLAEAKQMSRRSIKLLSRILAKALLNGHLGIWLLTRPLAAYLRWRVTERQLLDLNQLIVQQCNLPALIMSIRLLSIAPRTSQPQKAAASV